MKKTRTECTSDVTSPASQDFTALGVAVGIDREAAAVL